MIPKQNPRGEWMNRGRAPISFPVLLALFALVFPVMIAGGGKGNDKKILLEIPSCIPLKGEVRARITASDKLPQGGRFVWQVVGGTGGIRIRTRELDGSIDAGTARIKGLKSGRVDLLIEYRKKNSKGVEEVLAASETASTVVFGALIEPQNVVAIESVQTPIRLCIVPPQDPSFEIQSTSLEFRNSAGSILSSWNYPPALFVPDPGDPSRLILNAVFTPQAGLAGVSGLHLLFQAAAVVFDPVSGGPITLEAGFTALVTVKPAVMPQLSVSFAIPSTPFELDAGAEGYVDIIIESSNPAGTAARFSIRTADGTEIQSSGIDLSGFLVSGSTLSGRYDFVAPLEPGLFVIRVETSLGVETAFHEVNLTVTPAPMPVPVLDITTPSPVAARETVTVVSSSVEPEIPVAGETARVCFKLSMVSTSLDHVAWRLCNAQGEVLENGRIAAGDLETEAGEVSGELGFAVPAWLLPAGGTVNLSLQPVLSHEPVPQQQTHSIPVNIAPSAGVTSAVSVIAPLPRGTMAEGAAIQLKVAAAPGAYMPENGDRLIVLLTGSDGRFISSEAIPGSAVSSGQYYSYASLQLGVPFLQEVLSRAGAALMLESRIVDANGAVKYACCMPVTVLEQPRPMIEITGGVEDGEVPSLFLNGETELELKATDEAGNPLSGYAVECEVPYSRIKAELLTSLTGEDGGFKVRIHSPKSSGYSRIDFLLHGSDGRVIGNGEGGRLSFLVKVFTRVTLQTVIEMVHRFNLKPGERGKVISALAGAVSSRQSGLPPADLREAFLALADSDADALYDGLRVVGATQLMCIVGGDALRSIPKFPDEETLPNCLPGMGNVAYMDRNGVVWIIWCDESTIPPPPPGPGPTPNPREMEGMPRIPCIPLISTSYTIAVLIGFLVDVDVDSDNNNGFDTAAGGAWTPTTVEERMEDNPRLPGKVVGAGCEKRTPAAIKIWGLSAAAIAKGAKRWKISLEFDKTSFLIYREDAGGSPLEPGTLYTADYLRLDRSNPADLFIEGRKQTEIG